MRWAGYRMPVFFYVPERRKLPIRARLRVWFKVTRWKVRFWLRRMWVRIRDWGKDADPVWDFVKFMFIVDVLGIGACAYLIS